MLAIRQCPFVHSSNGRMDIWMSNGHFCSSNGQMDIYICPMDISVRPMDEWTFIYVQWTCKVYNATEAVMT